MKNLLRHKKALSPVIAAIILIAVTVAVSIAVAAWMGALTIGFMGTEELRILSVSFTGAKTGIAISVRNTGTVPIVISEVKMGSQSTSTLFVLDTGEDLQAGETGTITWTEVTWDYGTAYDIQVVTAKGNTFTYRATAPQ